MRTRSIPIRPIWRYMLLGAFFTALWLSPAPAPANAPQAVADGAGSNVDPEPERSLVALNVVARSSATPVVATEAPRPSASISASATPEPTRAATSPPVLASPSPSATPGRVAAPAPPRTFSNPVIDRDFPDPDLLRVGASYYAYATNSGGTNVQVASSRDLVAWERLGDALPSLPAWARPGRTWAPDVSATPFGFVLYFTAQHADSGRQCIGVATSVSPAGPFRAAASPIMCQLDLGGSIDPASFVDADGTRYLAWKNDGNCCRIQTRIFVQRVSANGLTLEGSATAILAADRAWEGGIIEAPTLWRQGGRYYAFYSANGYAGANYAIGYAVADSIVGPYRKADVPWISSAGAVVGPGGQDIVIAPDGSTWLAYHSWDPSNRYRRLNLDRLAWNGAAPVAVPSLGPQPVP